MAASDRRERNGLAMEEAARLSFSPADLHWAIAGWARVAPCVDGWMIRHVAAFAGHGEALLMAPPDPAGAPLRGPKFAITAMGMQAALLVDIPGKALRRIAQFPSLIDALHGLGPLDPVQQRLADELAERSAFAIQAVAGARRHATIKVDGTLMTDVMFLQK